MNNKKYMKLHKYMTIAMIYLTIFTARIVETMVLKSELFFKWVDYSYMTMLNIKHNFHL